MRQILILIISLFLCVSFCNSYAKTETLRLAATYTSENSGLLNQLNPVFEKDYGIKIKQAIVGSGQALRLGRQGDVDVLLTHSPKEETEFVKNGFGVRRSFITYNDFVLIGPKADPANVKGSNSIFKVFEKIYNSKSEFISRGDESGTHQKEKYIWEQTDLSYLGEGYVSAGQGMGKVLLLANEKSAYTLTDRGTYLIFKDRIELDILYEGDDTLYNPYHAIAVNPVVNNEINHKLANKYIDFLIGHKAQNIIRNYTQNGEQLFFSENSTWENQPSNDEFQKKGNFFIDSIISSLNLIFNFDAELFLVVFTSLIISVVAVLVASIISLPFSIIVALNQFPGKKLLMTFLNTLMALPTVVVGLLLYGLLNRQGLLGGMGLLYTQTAMVIGQCILIIPIICNLCISAVNSADPRLIKTCLSLGANFLQRCFIYANEVRFSLVAAIVAGFGRAIGEVGVAMMLGGNIDGYTRTMTTAIALETSKGEFEFALALGFMLLLVAFMVNILLQQFQSYKE